MRKILFLSVFAFACTNKINAIQPATATASEKPAKTKKKLFFRETDVANVKIVKNLQMKFGNFLRQLKQSAEAFENKIEEDLKKVKKGSPEYNKLRQKYEIFKAKVAQLENSAQEKMKLSLDSLQSLFYDALKQISKKYGNRAIYKFETVFAFIPEDADEFIDITGEFIAIVDKTKQNLPVELPIIQFN